MKKILLLFVSAILSVGLFAQNENDALRYSLINYSGTARFTGMSGAYGAVGADFSTLSQNPAGIGLYHKTEFTITPAFANSNTQSDFLNSSNKDYRNTLYLANAGYVMSLKLNENNGSHLKLIQLGFGMNRMAMFNNRMIVDGLNNNNSLMTNFLSDAVKSGPYPEDLSSSYYQFGAGVAYDANLLFQDTNNYWQADLPYGGLYQTRTIESRGGTTETALSAGSNFEDKLYFGVTFGFPHINYEQESVHTEKDNNNLSPFLKSFEYSEYLHTKGSGFNFKFGFIYKPVAFFRIGGAFHTPTSYFDMNDSWNTSMTSYFDQPPLTSSNATSFTADSKDGTYDYRLTTPMRALGSLAFIFGQNGILSADYEYIDYSTSRLNGLHATNDDFLDANNAIRSSLTAAHNLRIGTEWKAGIFAFRGGYSIYGSPYKGEAMTGLGSRQGYSLGIGIREKFYFLDFSYNHMESDDNYYIYSNAPKSENKYKSNIFSITSGFRF